MEKRRSVRFMEDLPLEVIQEILSRLPIKSLLECRCVCPTWHSLTKELHFATMHLAQSSRNQNPGLILQSWDSELYAIPDCNTSDVAIKLNNLPFKSLLPRFKLIGSCNGFLCLAEKSNNYRDVFICNPVTGEYKKLPNNGSFDPVYGASFGFGFGFEPEKKQYKVVRIRILQNYRKLEGLVHTIGTDSWRSIGTLLNIRGCPESPGILANGNLYWWGCKDSYMVKSIASVNLRDEKLRLIKTPPSVVGNNKYRRICLGSLGGCLYMYDYFKKHTRVWLMKDYGMEESWIKAFNIKRHTMHEGSNLNLCREIKSVGMLKDGKVLIQHDCDALFSYDPQSEMRKDLVIHGLPKKFEAISHVASLVSFKDAFVPESCSDEKIELERK